MDPVKQKLLTVSVCLAASLTMAGLLALAGAAAAFAVTLIGSAVLLFLLTRARSSYLSARLIQENALLDVGMARITSLTDKTQDTQTVNAVISGFGILLDGTPYKFGRDGVRLLAAEIRGEWMLLTYGAPGHTYQARLLHGITNDDAIMAFAHRLSYETGVSLERPDRQ